jgi:hypothetical protein
MSQGRAIGAPLPVPPPGSRTGTVRRRLPLVVLLVALVAGCTDSTPAEDRAVERLQAAVGATRDEETSRLSLTVSEAVGGSTGQQRGGGENVDRFAAEGEIEFTTSNLSLTFDLEDQGIPGAEGGSAEIRQIGDVFYVEIPGADRWIELDATGIAETLGDPSGLRSAVGASPNALLDLLAGTEQARRIGSEEIRGRAAEHFTANVDVAVAAEAATGESKAALERLSEQLAQTALPLEVWLDDDDRVVRMRIPVILEATPEEPEPPRITTTLELFDFGADVAIEAPPVDEIQDA